MNRVLENQFLKITVKDQGAELCSIYDQENEREVLWQADPTFWGRHAPVLFPNVGKHFENQYRLNGHTYPSKQHGFARDMTFACAEQAENFVLHQLTSTADTYAEYPFDFQLSIRHTLTERTLTVTWNVSVQGEQTMYFAIGGHPAFRVPVLPNTARSDYSLTFDGQDHLTYLLLDPATGTAKTDESAVLSLKNGSCFIEDHMFDRDALIFDKQITRAGIAFPDGSPYVELCCEGFPNFGIWSASATAPFVCLEPWMGRCDDFGFAGELSRKPFINSAKKGEDFQASYSIKVF